MSSQKSLVQKLVLKPGYQIRIVNAPPEYLQTLGQLPDGVVIAAEGQTNLDFLQIFASTQEELERLFQSAYPALKHDGILWLCYPKISSGVGSDITRDIGWEAIHAAGLRPAMQIAINGTWSALRFRPRS